MIQIQALNYILDSKDSSIITLNNLSDEFFSDYKKEFNYIKDHIEKYHNVPDKESFLANFPDFDLIKVNESANYIIDELYNDRNTRLMADTFNKVRDLILNKKTDEAMKLYSNAASQISSAMHLNCVDITKDLSRYDTYIEKSRDFNKSYIRTGFAELDAIIGGWDRYEEYATIVARSGNCKTWCLLRSAIAAAQQGLKVGIYSGEMSEQKIGYRIDTLLSHISNIKIMRGNTEVQNDYKEYIDNISKYLKGSILVLTPSMIGGPAGVTALKAFIEKEHLEALYIDQHSLLDDDRKAKNPVERASNISKDIKNLQVMMKIPIITVSQQNRESAENGMDTKLIAQSDRIGQDSTVVLFVEKKDDLLTLHLTKSRDSVNNKQLQYAIDIDKGIFTYIPTENDGLKGAGAPIVQNPELPSSINVSGEDVF